MQRKSVWTYWILLFVVVFVAACQRPDAPEYYGFGNIEVNTSFGQGAVLSTSLKFYNPNKFSVQLNHAEATVYLNDKLAGHSILDSTILIPQRDTFYIPVVLKIDLSNVLNNALSFLSTKGVRVVVNGKLKMKKGSLPFSVPLHYEGTENLRSVLQNY